MAYIVSSGVTSDGIILKNDSMTVLDSGIADGTTVNTEGRMYLSSGGTAENTMVYSRGELHVSSSGMAINTTVSSGAFFVSSGGTATGKMTFESGAVVSMYEGAILDFDLTQIKAGTEDALVNDLSIIQGTPRYTLTVDNKDWTPGIFTYALADGATGFTGTISVVNAEGEVFGAFAVGETVKIGYDEYTLNLTGSNLSVTVVVPDLTPEDLVGTKDRVSWSATGAEQYVVEYSTDQFEHAIRTETSGTAVDLLELPAGTYQWRVKADANSGWADGEDFISDNVSGPAKAVRSNGDGSDDAFFAMPDGTWGETGCCFLAGHCGSVNDWIGTGELVMADGKGRIRNLFFGSSDPNVLCLTDGENGDAIFVDDIYTDSPDDIAKETARLYRIQEIRAGAGDDIVDMTSQRFEYTGDGMTIRGGDGNDTIWANKGNNWLFGDAGNDRIVGASGDDVIAGGIGNDRMHGGGGKDTFTFCENWGMDNVEQLAGCEVVLWFAEGSLDNWDASKLTYTDGTNSVKVSGITADLVTLKFGDEGSDQFASLTSMGAFFDATTERIFEESGKGILASL